MNVLPEAGTPGVLVVALNPAEYNHDDALIVLDAERRTYAGLSRDGSYWHLIQPATELTAKANEYVGDDGLIVRPVAPGQFVCTCAAARFHRNCYRISQAEAYERDLVAARTWGLEPVNQRVGFGA